MKRVYQTDSISIYTSIRPRGICGEYITLKRIDRYLEARQLDVSEKVFNFRTSSSILGGAM